MKNRENINYQYLKKVIKKSVFNPSVHLGYMPTFTPLSVESVS